MPKNNPKICIIGSEINFISALKAKLSQSFFVKGLIVKSDSYGMIKSQVNVYCPDIIIVNLLFNDLKIFVHYLDKNNKNLLFFAFLDKNDINFKFLGIDYVFLRNNLTIDETVYKLIKIIKNKINSKK